MIVSIFFLGTYMEREKCNASTANRLQSHIRAVAVMTLRC